MTTDWNGSFRDMIPLNTLFLTSNAFIATSGEQSQARVGKTIPMKKCDQFSIDVDSPTLNGVVFG